MVTPLKRLACPHYCCARWVCCTHCASVMLLFLDQRVEYYCRFLTPLGESRYDRPFRLLHLIGIGALVLTIIGISNSGSTSANNMRRAGVLLFALIYIIIVGICLFLWSRIHAVMKYRKQVSFPEHLHLSDKSSYFLSPALEGHLYRTAIPGSSHAVQCPVHVLFRHVFYFDDFSHQ